MAVEKVVRSAPQRQLRQVAVVLRRQPSQHAKSACVTIATGGGGAAVGSALAAESRRFRTFRAGQGEAAVQ